jgi:hypothetical protein
MNKPQIKQWAAAYSNEDFLSVETCSGYRQFATDPEGKMILLSLTVSNEELGASILDALSASRFLKLEEISTFFDLTITNQTYDEWVELLIGKYGYKSKRELFKKMKHCLIERVERVITIKPTNHEKLEVWSGKGIGKDDYEVLDAKATSADLGAALKRCFDKCLGK